MSYLDHFLGRWAPMNRMSDVLGRELTERTITRLFQEEGVRERRRIEAEWHGPKDEYRREGIEILVEHAADCQCLNCRGK